VSVSVYVSVYVSVSACVCVCLRVSVSVSVSQVLARVRASEADIVSKVGMLQIDTSPGPFGGTTLGEHLAGTDMCVA